MILSMKKAFKVGARGSRLSRVQTADALDMLQRRFPGTVYTLETVSTPGDRDLVTPIEKSAPDFFTRDLDDAVRAGRIDFAVHSAKDLPVPMPPDLDWFWLPDRADPRDAWVVRTADVEAFQRRGRRRWRIGVSSERRTAYANKMYPAARLLSIRGAIDARLDQVLRGDYDAVLMAMAGLARLYPNGLPEGLTALPIPEEDLPPPEAQGALAVVFKAGDERMSAMRAHFVKAVRFVSAGVGDASLCTCAGMRDLSVAETVLYDDLLGGDLVVSGVPLSAKKIFVGKRCGAHALRQPDITRLICDEARKGRRVVRLKGGDAGLFGRLAEETDALTALRIPFVVRPGVSALTAATTATGLLLTRRGEARGFYVETPRSTGTETPRVLFMAVKMACEEAARLIAAGWSAATPCAFVFEAAGPREEVVRATLGTVARVKGLSRETRPGLFLIGRAAEGGWAKAGPLAGRRVLLTCSETVMDKAAVAVEDRGGRPVRWPLIRLVPSARFRACMKQGLAAYDGLVLTSPSAVRIFFETVPCDRRTLPSIFTCGAGTDAVLRQYGVKSDVMPATNYSAAGLIEEIARMNLSGQRILRLRSAKAGPAVARALRRAGARVDDLVLYENEFLTPGPLPPFEDVFFASASAVESFLAQYGENCLRGKGVYVMGGPTRTALPPAWRDRARFDLVPNGSFSVERG